MKAKLAPSHAAHAPTLHPYFSVSTQFIPGWKSGPLALNYKQRQVLLKLRKENTEGRGGCSERDNGCKVLDTRGPLTPHVYRLEFREVSEHINRSYGK